MNALDNFNFDEWAALASADPAAFEAKRRALLKAHIDAIPEAQAHVRAHLQRVLLDAAPSDGSAMDKAVDAFNLMQSSMVSLLDAHGSLAEAIAQAPDERLRVSAAQRFTRFSAK